MNRRASSSSTSFTAECSPSSQKKLEEEMVESPSLYPVIRDLSHLEYDPCGCDALSSLFVPDLSLSPNSSLDMPGAECVQHGISSSYSVSSFLTRGSLSSATHRPFLREIQTSRKHNSSIHKRRNRAFSDGAFLTEKETGVENESPFETNYVLTRLIFQSKRSAIWECVHRESGNRYCVKILSEEREIDILHRSQGPGIVQLIQRFKNHAVMEYCSGGNLLTRVIQERGLDEKFVQRMAHQLLEAVRNLHAHNTCHNDLTAANIMLQSDDSIRIIDFGSTKSGKCFVPERESSFASDMWSVGVILHFALTAEIVHSKELVDKLQKGSSWAFSRSCKQFLCNLVHLDPLVRLTAEEALGHAWLQDLVECNSGDTVQVEGLPEISKARSAGCTISNHRRLRSLTKLASLFKRSEKGPEICPFK